MTSNDELPFWAPLINKLIKQQQQQPQPGPRREQPVPKPSVFHRIGPPRRVENTPRPSKGPSTSNDPRFDNTKQKEKSSKKQKKNKDTRKSSKELNNKKRPSLPTPPATTKLDSNEILFQNAVQQLDEMALEDVPLPKTPDGRRR